MRRWDWRRYLKADTALSPADITPTWLGKILGASVVNVAATPVGTGQVGATYRYVPEYAGARDNAPVSVIGKFPSADPISRATGIEQFNYYREVNFYRRFARKRPLPVPSVYFTALNEENHDFTLIMADFPNHRTGNQLEPSTMAEAKLAMTAAAELHAPWWGDDTLDTLPWLSGSTISPIITPIGPLYDALWPAFCARYGLRVSDTVRAAGYAYLGHVGDWAHNRTGPRCLTHGDFRPDNMLFAPDGVAPPIIIVDWQTVGVGNGATDIAYFIGTALDPNMRRVEEHALFDIWLEGLRGGGVGAASTVGLWDIYRRDSFAGFLMGVVASMIVAQTDRGDTMFLTMCERAAAMMMDHGSIDLIG
jgi:Phosphotransferase enzyme family